MFSDKDLVAAFIDKRLTDNLAVFREYLPDIYDKFKSYQENRFFLIYDQDGNINLFDKKNGSLLYSKNPVQQCLDNLSDFKNNPVQRGYYVASAAFDGVERSDNVNYMHSSIMNKLAIPQVDVLKYIIESLAKKHTLFDQADCSLPGKIKTLFFLSTGLGFDLESLYLDHDVRHLFVIEPDFDVFYASLQLVDWRAIFEKSLKKGFSINIFLNDDHSEMFDSIWRVSSKIGRHNLAGTFLYSGFYLDDYSELYKEIKHQLDHRYLVGYGFYDDSRYSLSHTMGNLKNNIPLFSSNKSISKVYGQELVSVFIVGNGPSLDNDIDFIKNNQNKALIVSCGSALRSLLINDIRPDAHVELERTAQVPCWIEASADGIDGFFDQLKNIKLIGASQVHPDVFGFFDQAGQVLKDSEAGTYLPYYSFKDSGVAVVPSLAPSGVHAAITVFVNQGFKKFYFFGTDMGTVNPDLHHSKDSLYVKINKEKHPDAWKFKADDVIFSSNFEEKEIYSSGVYPMFKTALELMIKEWNIAYSGGLSFFNCSDGALIEGAKPLSSCDISFDPISEGKREIFDKVFDAFFSFYPGEHYQEVLNYLESTKVYVEGCCDWISSAIVPVSNLEEAFGLVDRFSAEFHDKSVLSDEYAWLYTFFDGSLLYGLSVVNSTLQLPAPEAVVVKAVNEQFSELKEFFQRVKVDFLENCLECDKRSRYSI